MPCQQRRGGGLRSSGPVGPDQAAALPTHGAVGSHMAHPHESQQLQPSIPQAAPHRSKNTMPLPAAAAQEGPRLTPGLTTASSLNSLPIWPAPFVLPASSSCVRSPPSAPALSATALLAPFDQPPSTSRRANCIGSGQVCSHNGACQGHASSTTERCGQGPVNKSLLGARSLQCPTVDPGCWRDRLHGVAAVKSSAEKQTVTLAGSRGKSARSLTVTWADDPRPMQPAPNWLLRTADDV
jgi:hypothetical protein